MRVKGQEFAVSYYKERGVVVFSGTMRLRNVREYDQIRQVLRHAHDDGDEALTLDFCELRFLNSSGITMLGQFLVDARRADTKPIVLRGSSERPWQSRSLDTLRRIWPKIQLVIEKPEERAAEPEPEEHEAEADAAAEALPETNSIFGHLARKQTAFEDHAFFAFLRTNPETSWVWEFIPGMGFWVKTFQDILRLVRERVASTEAGAMAQHILEGDIGHDEWFVTDLKALEMELPTVLELFGPAHQHVRLGSYALVSEVYRADNDVLLLVLLLGLESASYVFFTGMAAYLEGNEFPVELKYFGRNHLNAELEHGIVESGMDAIVEEACARDPELYDAAVALIERIFDAFTLMFVNFLPPERRGEQAAS